MSTTDLAPDLDRVLDSAIADVGEAQQLRRRIPSEAGLRRGLGDLVSADVAPGELDAAAAARRATALFILGRDAEVGPFAERSESHRVHYLWGMSELYRDRPLNAAGALQGSVNLEPRDEQSRLQLAAVTALLGKPAEAREGLALPARVST
jgi:hypothetical protein